ncbi:MAG TPA: Stk1 family PASTA domain-containing Ser/Thr kinase [Gaiellaceae bacterium]|nr:Stk1 family PASTA domain-containing Ser/Thr kinase [Gaiellaceae bacterium]
MATPDTLIDQVFDGRYKVVRRLGTGGMANVYLAEDQELGRRVAIKVLDDRHSRDEQFVERFRREAKNAAGLSHPNIVSIYDRGQTDDAYYIAMEYLEGRTLKELLVTRGPTPLPVAIDYARQILGALGFAHRNGIVHRDIKPHNVIVAPDGRLKVTDFGIARAGASQMTETGSIIGTAQYLSPEQAKGAPVTPASDIYSVGIVLYEMLTGTVPFTGDTPLEIAMKHLSAVPKPPSTLREEVPHELDSVVLRALAKDPADRYQSAEEMDADLAQVARGKAVAPETEEAATHVLSGAGATLSTAPTQVVRRGPVTVVPPAPPAPPYGRPSGYYEYDEPIRRRSVWPWLLALVLIAAAVVAGWYVYTKIQDQLAQTKPVAVPLVEGQLERLAVGNVEKAGLKVRVRRQPNERVDIGHVYDQTPDAGERIDKGNTVVVLVSTGKPKVTVPGVTGDRSEDAVAAIAARGLKADLHRINSDKEAGTVTGQFPKAGTRVTKGDRVRINVSQGPKPIAVPPVVGSAYESAAATLQGAGFAVARREVDANDPKGVVVQMDPGANTLAAKGSTVTLFVSKGPTESAIPDVTSFSRVDAIATLRNSGFKVLVQVGETGDPNYDGAVLTQFPAPGEKAKPGTTVTITVGHYTAPPTTEETTTTTEPTTTETVPTETLPTDTTPTDTVPTDTVPTDTIPGTP